jgi:uncharacterized membrane protein
MIKQTAVTNPTVRARTARTVTVSATVLTGLAAGFFYAYADSIRHGLGHTDDPTYVRSFQAINEHVRSPVFMLVFAGPLILLGTAAAVSARDTRSTAAMLAVAAIVYLVGVVGVTAAGNLPLNDKLALATTTTQSNAATARQEFENRWNNLNLVRTVSSLLSVGLAAASCAKPQNLARRSPSVGSVIV